MALLSITKDYADSTAQFNKFQDRASFNSSQRLALNHKIVQQISEVSSKYDNNARITIGQKNMHYNYSQRKIISCLSKEFKSAHKKCPIV